VSDVDLLALDANFLTYYREGQRARSGGYTSPSTRTSVDVLKDLRAKSESALKLKFPTATVDTTGAKAICISGGSLARPVDVVPSHWLDTIEYQSSGMAHDRAVTILDNKVPTTVDSLPFLHIKRVGDRDDQLRGGIRASIRLCKNVKADAENEGKRIALPSFDIAATMYHADPSALSMGHIYELGILAETQRHLDALWRNQEYAKTLRTPDGSRSIFDSADKFTALLMLSSEIDDLAREVAREQDVSLQFTDSPALDVSRSVLAKTYIAA